jgi:hypothetical protein
VPYWSRHTPSSAGLLFVGSCRSGYKHAALLLLLPDKCACLRACVPARPTPDNQLRSAGCAAGLRRLARLDLRNNELTTLEPQLGLLPALKWVGLDGNPLRSLRRELASGPCSALLKSVRGRRRRRRRPRQTHPFMHAAAAAATRASP